MSLPERRVLRFVLFDGCELLDFAGPMQAFHEANDLIGSQGIRYQIHQHALKESVVTEQGLRVAGLLPLPMAEAEDLILVPGYVVSRVHPEQALIDWLRSSFARGARVASICTGAFALAEAGILDGRQCTTHWKRVKELATRFPLAHVAADRLFVEDGRVKTSAGIAAGIDMALAIIEQDHGARLAAEVAREMVVYLRRDPAQSQSSVYLAYRNHIDPLVHGLQDKLCADPAMRLTLAELAGELGCSERTLTRIFRKETGISIAHYRQQLRMEQARTLLANPELTLDDVALQCGYEDVRQLRRVFVLHFGCTLSAYRRQYHTST